MWLASLTGQWVTGSVAGLLLGIGIVRFIFDRQWRGDKLDWICVDSFIAGLILALVLYVRLGF